MLRVLVSSFVVLAFVTFTQTASAQSLGRSSAVRANLDLPFNAARDNADEQITSDVVPLFGNSYEAQAVVFLVGSSNGATNQTTKDQLRSAIASLSPRTRFAVVSVESTTLRSYPPQSTLVPASARNKVAAKQFIESVREGSGSNLVDGFAASLARATKEQGRRRLVIYVGSGRRANGVAAMKSAMASVNSLNSSRVAEIHTVAVGSYGPCQRKFLHDVAESHRGTYTERGTRRSAD